MVTLLSVLLTGFIYKVFKDSCFSMLFLVVLFLWLAFWAGLQACIQVCPNNPVNFNIDNVRVAKILGGGINDCCVVRGMVLKSDAVGTIKHVKKAKVGVYIS